MKKTRERWMHWFADDLKDEEVLDTFHKRVNKITKSGYGVLASTFV